MDEEVAPRNELRMWFDHRPERFASSQDAIAKSLSAIPPLAELKQLGKHDVVTLLYGARDPKITHAVILLSMLGARQRDHEWHRRGARQRAP